MICASVQKDNQQALVTGLSPIDTKPYNNLLMEPACICTLFIARDLMLNIGILLKAAIITFKHIFFSGKDKNVIKVDTNKSRGISQYYNSIDTFTLIVSLSAFLNYLFVS